MNQVKSLEIFAGNDKAEIVSVQNKPYMFINEHVNRDSIPEGFFAYDIRDNMDGQFWQIKPEVDVNHWGTIIGKEPVILYDKGGTSYDCPPDVCEPEFSMEGWYTGDYVTSPEEYLARYDTLKAMCEE